MISKLNEALLFCTRPNILMQITHTLKIEKQLGITKEKEKKARQLLAVNDQKLKTMLLYTDLLEKTILSFYFVLVI